RIVGTDCVHAGITRRVEGSTLFAQSVGAGAVARKVGSATSAHHPSAKPGREFHELHAVWITGLHAVMQCLGRDGLGFVPGRVEPRPIGLRCHIAVRATAPRPILTILSAAVASHNALTLLEDDTTFSLHPGIAGAYSHRSPARPVRPSPVVRTRQGESQSRPDTDAHEQAVSLEIG